MKELEIQFGGGLFFASIILININLILYY